MKLHAFRNICYVGHNDGTPDTEIIDLLCGECAVRMLMDKGVYSSGEISYQLHEEMNEYEGDTLEHIKRQALDYTQAIGTICPHLEEG